MFTSLNKIKKQKPLVHCLIGGISSNYVANMLLAIGARPIMAEHPLEVEEVTEKAAALLINIGNIVDNRIKSIFIAGKTASKHNIPIIFDPVGAACNSFRYKLSMEIIQQIKPTIIKGNMSEIKALAHINTSCTGIDVCSQDITTSDSIVENCNILINLAKKLKCVVVSTGALDIVADSTQVFVLNNGSSLLSNITGTGCTSGALIAAYTSTSLPLNASIEGLTHLNIAGEYAEKDCTKTDMGIGSFNVKLLDHIGNIKTENLIAGGKIKCIHSI